MNDIIDLAIEGFAAAKRAREAAWEAFDVARTNYSRQCADQEAAEDRMNALVSAYIDSKATSTYCKADATSCG